MSNQVQPAFFDLHVEGVGYLNRVRTVRPKKGQEFLACTISAMRGAAGQVEYTKFDCRVSGAEAKQMVRLLVAWQMVGFAGVPTVPSPMTPGAAYPTAQAEKSLAVS